MASYAKELQQLLYDYLDETFSDKNVYVRNSIKDVAREAMVPENNDPDVANAICEFIKENYMGSEFYAVAEVAFNLIPKRIFNTLYTDIIRILKTNRDDPPYPLYMILSDGNVFELEYNTNLNEPKTIMVSIYGGEDPEGKEVTRTFECPGAKTVQQITDTEYQVTFDKTGTYTMTATSTDQTEHTTSVSETITVNPSTNLAPTNMTITLSCGNSLQLGEGNAPKTITAKISGGVDPEGKGVTKTVECSTATSVSKVNDNEWNITLATTGIHLIMATAVDPTGQKTVNTATVQVTGSTTSSGTTTGQFDGETFDSGWCEKVPQCYISNVTFSLLISSGHSSSTDYLVVLGERSNGTIFIVKDNFNTANKGKEITPGQELGNGIYKRGNLSSTTWKTNENFDVKDDIRRVRFICETPGHASCASQAKVTFNLSYSYDSSLS